ncbi:hypothetical protein K3495_g5831 [Podosphaera aphanis]|nr:hypothetical protein K3495_g5831 [Podosphaera aphanis]
MASGRLKGFVNRIDRSASPFNNNNDRKAAQSLKFTARPALPSAQEYAPATQHMEHQALALDSTVGSDFDHTKSDIPMIEPFVDIPPSLRQEDDRLRDRPSWDQEQQLSLYNPHRNVQASKIIPEHNVNRNDIHYATGGRYVAQQENASVRASITGRFQPLEKINLELRGDGPSAHAYHQEDCAPREPLHSEQGDSDMDRLEEVDDDLNSEITTRNSTPSRPRNLRMAKIENAPQADSNTIDPETDYNDEALKKMKYSELEAQSWEDIPSRKVFSYPRELRGPKITLETKMDYYLAVAHKDKVPAGPARKTAEAFYEQLSSKEWDQAGEIFIEKFTGLMQKLQEKRREKRHIAEEFEKEVQARERVVRGHLDKLDKKLDDMRANGESLLVN